MQKKMIEKIYFDFPYETYIEFSGNIAEEVQTIIIEIIKIYIEKYLVLFKNEAFYEEKERRIYLSEDKNNYEIRERNGVFFPYVQLKMKDSETSKLPIKKIYISPRTLEESQRAKIGLNYMLKKYGYDDIDIISSSIPLRV